VRGESGGCGGNLRSSHAKLADGQWHSYDELKEVSYFPERWVEEFRRDGLEVLEEDDRIALAPHDDDTPLVR
jgi:hypothetical protein